MSVDSDEESKRVELPAKQAVRELPLYPTLFRATMIILLIMFILGNITCLTLFVLNAFSVTSLSDVALCALATATIAEVGGLFTILLKKLV